MKGQIVFWKFSELLFLLCLAFLYDQHDSNHYAVMIKPHVSFSKLKTQGSAQMQRNTKSGSRAVGGAFHHDV